MSGNDSETVTCEWFVNDLVKTKSFPARALSQHRPNDPIDLETLRGKSLEELSKLWQDLIAGNSSQIRAVDAVLRVGDVFSLKSGGPRMTIVAISEQKGQK